jgi:hypothetical protein
MKKFVLLISISCMAIAAKAQDWTGAVYRVGMIYPGFYVTNSNDTVNGYFYHGTQAGNQKKCIFYVNEMDKRPKAEFSPEDIKSYKVGDKLYRTLNYSGGLMKKPLRFLLVTKDGAITQLTFYSEDGNATAEGIFHKPKDPSHSDPVTYSYFALGFAKKLSDYISDYPELSAKVSGKEKGYGMLNLLAIIDEFNAWYASKH